MSAASGSVQSVDRTLDILEMVASFPQGISLSELAHATALHVSTAHRLVSVLVERGYIIKDTSTGKYRLTLRTFEIGSQASSIWSQMPSIRPILDGLASVSKEAVHLVERDDYKVTYLYKAEPFQQMIYMSSHVGLRNPMYCTGVGKSIMALLSREQVREIWDREDIRAFTDTTITTFADMEKELSVIRSRGFAIDNEEHEPGVRCIAAAVRNWCGKPIGAVSISAPISRMEEKDVDQLVPLLIKATDDISRILGYSTLS